MKSLLACLVGVVLVFALGGCRLPGQRTSGPTTQMQAAAAAVHASGTPSTDTSTTTPPFAQSLAEKPAATPQAAAGETFGATRPAMPAAKSSSAKKAGAKPAAKTAGTTSGSTPVVAGQSGLHTPAEGSAERKAILTALQAPVEKQLNQPVVFEVQHIAADGSWAFASGRPTRADGSKIDYSKTPYAQAYRQGAFGDDFSGLLHQVSGSWKVIAYHVGATDVVWLQWDQTYGAPASIFPAP